MDKTYLVVQVLLITLFTANPVYANSVIPLDQSHTSILSEAVAANTQSPRVIKKSQLLGAWADFEVGSDFRSTWTFTDNVITFLKYDGLEVKEKYSLRNNQIIIHHRRNVFNDGSWDEHINLISFDGKTLLWELIGQFEIHKIR